MSGKYFYGDRIVRSLTFCMFQINSFFPLNLLYDTFFPCSLYDCTIFGPYFRLRPYILFTKV